MLYTLLGQTQLKIMSKSGFRTLTNFNLKSAAAQPKMLRFEKFQKGPSFLGVYFPKMPYVKNRGSHKKKVTHSDLAVRLIDLFMDGHDIMVKFCKDFEELTKRNSL